MARFQHLRRAAEKSRRQRRDADRLATRRAATTFGRLLDSRSLIAPWRTVRRRLVIAIARQHFLPDERGRLCRVSMTEHRPRNNARAGTVWQISRDGARNA